MNGPRPRALVPCYSCGNATECRLTGPEDELASELEPELQAGERDWPGSPVARSQFPEPEMMRLWRELIERRERICDLIWHHEGNADQDPVLAVAAEHLRNHLEEIDRAMTDAAGKGARSPTVEQLWGLLGAARDRSVDQYIDKWVALSRGAEREMFGDIVAALAGMSKAELDAEWSNTRAEGDSGKLARRAQALKRRLRERHRRALGQQLSGTAPDKRTDEER